MTKGIFKFYLLLLLVLDIGWATFLSYFGGSLLALFGSSGDMAAPDVDKVVQAGSVLVFVIGLFQSLVFDAFLTMAIFGGLFLYGIFKSATSR